METVKSIKTNFKMVSVIALSLGVVTVSSQWGTHKSTVPLKKSFASITMPTDTVLENKTTEVSSCLSPVMLKNSIAVAKVYHANTSIMFKAPVNELPSETQTLDELVKFKIEAQPEGNIEEPVEMTLAELVKFKDPTNKEAEIQEPDNCTLNISELIKFHAPTIEDSVTHLEPIGE
ncbi:hypothetical protein NF867_13900 [Solitalea sp. MAHUQ-68]|uniref:Uncharacterized protein n=1 Tax=Solitalea agri TaxID=2953739 RepID=A0A9X2F384_9SPHI|nr:hypothetical protein [Solitalea agri]MCO4293954.1 hypothetical protein [Solitalea agri]